MSYNAALAGGPYTFTYGGSSIGLMERDTQALEVTPLWEILNNSHSYAMNKIGALQMGADVSIRMSLRYWSSTVKGLIWPWSATWGTMGQDGRDAFDLASAGVFTVVSGTPAATAGPASVTAAKCIITAPYAVNLSTTWRVIPVVLTVFLDGSGNYFSST